MQSARSNNAIEFLNKKTAEIQKSIIIDKSYYNDSVKRGLRNADGTGVMAGVTRIGNVNGYYVQDGERMPMAGPADLPRHRCHRSDQRFYERGPLRL